MIMDESSNSSHQELSHFRSDIVKLNNGNDSMKSNEEEAPTAELIPTQYINIHRVSDPMTKEYIDCEAPVASALMNNELMQHHVIHGGMVDIIQTPMPTDYSQHHLERTSLPQYMPEQYDTTEDLLPSDLTEEDRRLAAALVAVQLSQQQKHQLNHHNIITSESNVIVSPGGTPRLLGTTAHKASDQLPSLPSLSPHPEDNYIQTVTLEEEESHPGNNVHHHQGDRIMKMYQPQPHHQDLRLPPLPPLKKVLSNHSMGVRNQYLRPHTQEVSRQGETLIEIDGRLHQLVAEEEIQHQESLIKEEVQYVVKNEGLGLYYEESNDTPLNKNDSDYDVENDMRSSRRSLPHKKRIPRKLKNIKSSPLPTRSVAVKIFKCNKCAEQFDSQASLTAHRLTHNIVKKPFSCEICSKGFANQLKFFEHLKSHYEPLKGLNFGSEISVTKHKDNNVAKEMLPAVIKNDVSDVKTVNLTTHSCLLCNKNFRRQKAYETHMNLFHPKHDEMEEFSEPEDLMAGIREVVGGVDTGDEADLDALPSPKSSTDKDWYPDEELHATEVDIQELEQEHQNMCDFCGEQFEDKHQLELHVTESHYELKEEMIKTEDLPLLPRFRGRGAPVKRVRKGGAQMSCPQCGRLFNHRNSLVYHLRSHSGERPHQCEVCGKSFFAASALKVHMRLHSGDKPYKCEYCGRHFRQWGDLKYHCISIHSEEKNYQCEYCGKDFARKYSLIVHRRIHTGEKNYKCEFCEKSFRASSYLQNHRRIHTGEKPYPCEVCGKPFRVRSDMKRHLNTHNRDRVRATGHHEATEPKIEHEQDSEQLMLEQQALAVEQIARQSDDSILPDEETSGDRAGPSLEVRQLHQQLTGGSQVSEEVMHYSRDQLEVVREGGNTLYVWPVFMS